jgi:hypothetical protein
MYLPDARESGIVALAWCFWNGPLDVSALPIPRGPPGGVHGWPHCGPGSRCSSVWLQVSAPSGRRPRISCPTATSPPAPSRPGAGVVLGPGRTSGWHYVSGAGGIDWVTFRAIWQGGWDPANPTRETVLRQLGYAGGPFVLELAIPLLVESQPWTRAGP